MGVFRYRRVFPCVGNFDIIISVFLFDPDGTAVFVLMIYRKREKSYFFFFCHARLLEDREISEREREREKLAIRGYRSSRHLNSGVKENTHGGIKNQKGQKIEGDKKKHSLGNLFSLGGIRRRFTLGKKCIRFLREFHHISMRCI